MADTTRTKESLFRTAFDLVTKRWVNVKLVEFIEDVAGNKLAVYEISTGDGLTGQRLETDLDRLCL
jgi:hypothetical protein